MGSGVWRHVEKRRRAWRTQRLDSFHEPRSRQSAIAHDQRTRHAGRFCRTDSGYTVYFAARFDRPFSQFGTWQQLTVVPGATDASGLQAGTWLSFDAMR